MNGSQFHHLADRVFAHIESILDASELDLDYERVGSIFYLYFPDGTKIIINKQEPLHELWLATPENGFHFQYQNNTWVDKRSDQKFYQLLTTTCQKLLEDTSLSF